MMKMWAAQLGLFLLSLYFISSQVVQAQNTTDAPMSTTMNYTMTTSSMNSTIADKNSGGRIDAFTLLLPLAVAASLLHGYSQ